jgi:hypothetical protein
MRRALSFLFVFALLPAGAVAARAQTDGAQMEERVLRAPMSMIANKQRAALIVNRSLSVDTRGRVHGVINEVFDLQSRATPRHDYAYELVSKRLEKYAREGGSLTLVEELDEADFVIVFKVVREVRSFAPDEPFIYGEMFIFLNKTPDEPVPALLWRSKDDTTSPEDATRELIKQLKTVRGEK